MGVAVVITRQFQKTKGFSLLEVAIAIAVLGVVLIYIFDLTQLVRGRSQVQETRKRMDQIVRQLKMYYRSNQNLPPDDMMSPMFSVPVTILDLPQKMRFDTYGQYFVYRKAEKQDEYTGQRMTDIEGFQVDGSTAAGALISFGPDQVQEQDYKDTQIEAVKRFGDDIVVPVHVGQEALEIVAEELEVLEKRVLAYDRFFAGVGNDNQTPGHNDSIFNATNATRVPVLQFSLNATNASTANATDIQYNGTLTSSHVSYSLIDEDGCVPAITNSTGNETDMDCLYAEHLFPSAQTTAFLNDPNCGRATIDACPTALEELLVLYDIHNGMESELADRFLTDPWGHIYRWGCGLEVDEDDTRWPVQQNDRRYHHFFSMGPDGRPGTSDDLTP